MTILSILLSAFFLFASSIKITGWQNYIHTTQMSFFKKYGLTQLHMILIGIIELSAAISLLISNIFNVPTLMIYGALSITIVSSGAIVFHCKYDTIKDAIPAITTLLMSVWLVGLSNVFTSL